MKEHLETTEDVLVEWGSRRSGLSASAAAERREVYGRNTLDDARTPTMLSRVWAQIKNPMILVLVSAGIVSGAFGELADMVIILIVVVLNSILGIYQEGKAEQAIRSLQKMAEPHATVRRDGDVLVVAADDLVPGDIVLLEAGAAVPADMRVIATASLKIEESPLTGESVPVDKHAAPLEPATEDVALGDRRNMAYLGTNVTYGRGEGVVTATGMNTEMGKIARILSGADDEKTPLQTQLAGLSKVLSVAVLGVCVFVFGFTVLRAGGFGGGHVLDALLLSVSLAVAAIPEGLVVVVTVLLSIGVTRMSHRNALIRRMTAVETLGCTDVICSDKTGTLTQNRMTVVDHFGDESLLATAMSLCNDTHVDHEGTLLGDPTEVALVEYARTIGGDRAAEPAPRRAEAPFDSERKLMSTLHELPGSTLRQYTKGAPDELLRRCTAAWVDGETVPLTSELRARVLAENQRMARGALRVLGAAMRDHAAPPRDFSSEHAEQELVFIGLVGLIDPIRPEARAAIAECKTAGIRPVMITGDHRDTAVAIARDLGILREESEAMTGAELSALTDKEFADRIRGISVYARVQPEHKVRIVAMWKTLGKVTAMTGDGVNDAPAVKSADIGVGMGITGTDVTKNVADMVLADDNFASIVYAVEEGRRIYENIRKAVQFLLASNLAEVVAIFVATIAGFRLLAPIHILWINLITDTFPAMALGMEKAEPDSMRKPPRDAAVSIFADGLGFEVIWQGALVGLLTLASFFAGNAVSPVTGMTMAFLTLSMCEVFHATNMRSRDRSVFSLKHQSPYLWGAMALSFALTVMVIYVPGLNTVFQLMALTAGQFFTALGIAFSIIPVVEFSKLLKRATRTRTASDR